MGRCAGLQRLEFSITVRYGITVRNGTAYSPGITSFDGPWGWGVYACGRAITRRPTTTF